MNGFIISLCWMLIHSVWISLSLWFIFSVIERVFKESKVKRSVKILGLVFFHLCTLAALFLELPNSTSQVSEWILFDEALFFERNISLLDQLKFFIEQNSYFIVGIWFLGSSIGIAHLIRQKHDLNLIERSASRISEPSLKSKLNLLRGQLGISRFVQLMESQLINSPMTIGLLKPIIYLPVGLSTGLKDDEIESILLHELAHIKRHDYLTNWFLVLTETVFFFNPIIHIQIKNLRREMEFTCDDEVLRQHNEIHYAKTLVKLEEFNLNNKLALQAKNNNSEFSKRINRMIKQQKPVAHHKMMISAILMITLIISSAFTNVKPENIKPADSSEDAQQDQRQDTLRFTSADALAKRVKEMNDEEYKGTVLMLNGKHIRVIKDVNNSLKKADDMMEEIQKELIEDGILNANRTKITLMFQYSDVLNGKKSLGEHYEKYKGILNRYFPVYDSFATTRVFRYKGE